MVHYDGTVRNSNGEIIQLLYGEDGLDSVAIESQKFEHMLVSDIEFKERYEFDVMSGNIYNSGGDTFLLERIIDEIVHNAESMQKLRQEIAQLREDRKWLQSLVFDVVCFDHQF